MESVEAVEMDDARAIRQARLESFDAFFSAEYRRVVGLALVLCGRQSVAEECAQDAFVAAFRHWHRIANYDDAGAWVRRVAANLATSTLRRRAREARAVARLALRRELTNTVVGFDHEFWAIVRDLPRRQAQCVALRYLEDRSIAEIAAVLGIAPATVRVHLHDARATLAARLHETEDEET
jgi:RNA polymerase sigma-70 factor (ECF subfamily)